MEVEDEVFQRELRKMGSSSRRSVSEPRGVTSWARNGQEADGKDSEGSETIYRDEDVRVRVPKRTSSRAHSTSQRRSDANSATRKIEQGPGQETREKLKAAESNLASSRRSVTSLELRPGKRPSDQSEVIEGSQSSRRQDGEGPGVRSGRASRIASPRKERMKTPYSGWEEPNLIHQTARRVNLVPQEETSPTDRVDLPRRSGEGMGVCPSRTPRITPPRREGVDVVYSGWEEPNFSHRTVRKASPVPQEEMSLMDRVNLPRRSGEGMGVHPNRTPRIAPP